MKVVMSIFLTSDWAFLLLIKCEMDIFSSWIEIPIVDMKYDFPKCKYFIFDEAWSAYIIFFVNCERALFFAKRDLYTPPK